MSRLPAASKFLRFRASQAKQSQTSKQVLYADRARNLIDFVIHNHVWKGGTVLLPRFMCFEGLFARDARVQFYEVGYDYKPLDSSFANVNSNDLVFIVNYHGYSCLPSLSIRQNLCNSGVTVVIDNTHSYGLHCRDAQVSLENESTVTSYIKSLPIPLGSELIMHKSSQLAESMISERVCGPALSWLSMRSLAYFCKENFWVSGEHNVKGVANNQYSSTSVDRKRVLAGWKQRWLVSRWLQHIDFEGLNAQRESCHSQILSCLGYEWSLEKMLHSPAPTDVPMFLAGESEASELEQRLRSLGASVYRWPQLSIEYAGEEEIKRKARTLLFPTTSLINSSMLDVLTRFRPRVPTIDSE
jgi:hypothetical protein